MQTLPEKFLVNLFVYTFFALFAILFLITFFIIRKKEIFENIFKNNSTNKPLKNKKRKNKEIEGEFAEKLGEKVVQYMIEVSYADNEVFVRDRINRIIKECEKLNSKNLPSETKDILSTVLLWAKKFNTERHVREMRILKKSSLIAYNKKKKDFKLLIPSE